jgi:hypothetical protein
MSWINFSAVGKIIVFGLLAGAGLPAVFAIGLSFLSHGPRPRAAGADGEAPDAIYGGSVLGLVAAAACFLIVGAAIGWGIFEIYQTGHPKK